MEKVRYSSSPFVIDDTQRCEKTIGTHNGTFHCDEALAVFLLRQTNTFRDAGKAILYSRNSYSYFPLDLKRSRDPDVLGACDIVVDVGAVYDEATLRFDHHQRGFTEVFGHGFETKLSSAGLVYKSASLHLLVFCLSDILAIDILEKMSLRITFNPLPMIPKSTSCG